MVSHQVQDGIPGLIWNLFNKAMDSCANSGHWFGDHRNDNLNSQIN